MHFKKAIVSSGPTREWIDPVRYISNASSGKMGFHIAEELVSLIPEVVYVRGNVYESYRTITGARDIHVESTIQMRDTILSEITDNTLLIMAAAPADFRPKTSAENKIKKEGKTGMTIELESNPDILVSVKDLIASKQYKDCVLIGFAAETEKLEEHALGKLERKGLTYIIGNYVSAKSGFGEVNSSIKIFSKTGLSKEIQDQSKEVLAKEIVLFISSSLGF